MHGFTSRSLTSLAFAISAFCCLLSPSAQAQPALPPGVFIAFTFPGYSTLHDCSFFQDDKTPLSAKACIDMLQQQQKLAKTDTEYAKNDFFRKFIGEFGPNPLLYAKADMLFCQDYDCRALQPHRSGPPEMMWRPPDIANQKTALVYPLAHSVPRVKLKLSLTLADGEWRSNLFVGDFWLHNYMHVRFSDSGQRLIVERDWIKTLSDPANYAGMWSNHLQVPVLVWLLLLGIAALAAMVLGLRKTWRWPDLARALLTHGGVLAALIAVFVLIYPHLIGKTTAWILFFMLFGLTAPIDARLMHCGGKTDMPGALRLQILLRIPGALLLLLVLYLMFI